MAKLYWTCEVKEIFDQKIQEVADKIINDDTIEESQVVRMVKQVRMLRAFANEVVADMEAADKAEDERREAERAKKEADGSD